jgi:hypothetical protein
MISDNSITFTLAEYQVWEIIDSIDDRIEQLSENVLAVDLHTLNEVNQFKETINSLRTIRNILNER